MGPKHGVLFIFNVSHRNHHKRCSTLLPNPHMVLTTRRRAHTALASPASPISRSNPISSVSRATSARSAASPESFSASSPCSRSTVACSVPPITPCQPR